VTGWVHVARDHGGVIFVDVRDREGLVQCVFRPEVSTEVHTRAGELRSEFVVAVRGVVERRSVETVNTKLPTGRVGFFNPARDRRMARDSAEIALS